MNPQPPSSPLSTRVAGHLRTFVLAYLVLASGLVFSGILSGSLRSQYQRREELSFRQKSEELLGRLDSVLLSYEVFLRGVAGYFSSSQQVAPFELEAYLRTAIGNLTNSVLLDIGFAERVGTNEMADHTERIRQAGNPEYFIQRPEGPVEGGHVYPITQISDFNADAIRAIGWDLGQERARLEVLRTAVRTRNLAVSGPISLHREMSTNSLPGVLAVLPVFVQQPDTQLETNAHPVGFVFGSILTDQLWKPYLQGLDGVQFRILADSDPTAPPVFASSGDPGEPGEPTRSRVGTLERLGRRWRVEFLDSPAFAEQFHSPLPGVVLGVGTAFTLVLSVVASILALRRRDAELSAVKIGESESRARAALAELAERERQIADERDRLAVTLKSIGDAVITTDVDGRILSLNRAAENLLGRSEREVLGVEVSRILSLRHRESGQPFLDLGVRLRGVAESDLIPGFFQFAREGHQERTLVVALSPLRARRAGAEGRVVVLRDLTERRQLEEEQIRAVRLESVGLLAGGIAHDFNNYLTAILGNLSLARDSKGADLETLLERTEHGVRRAQRLTQQLLTFSKGGAPVVRPTDLRELVRDTAEFAVRGATVRCEFTIEPGLWTTAVDPAQISRVIQNLIVNASQAMTSGGVIHIAMANQGAMPRLGDGRYVRVSVIDDGPGIAPAHLARIFEPYFSTKSGGSGLGLATAFRIVRQHRGDIVVRSEPGQGATFDLYLPATDEVPVPEVPVPGKPVRGIGRVLVMDDEQAIRDVARAMLRRLGYEVECVANGTDAVQLYREAMDHGKRYDVVLLDLTIPDGLGGLETAAMLREGDPEVVTVVSSGYSVDPIMADHLQHGFAGVLPKPYRLDEMAQVMDRVRRR
jgi:PAS domain S-box-containing protein